MIKAIFLDFYGTIVHEDGIIIRDITKRIYKTGKAKNQSEIGAFWWNDFQNMFKVSKADTFITQRELELRSLQNTLEHFSSSENALELSNLMYKYWQAPPIFEDSKEFFYKCPVPIYIVSNIDAIDIIKAMDFHNIIPAGFVTSEEALSYKPQKEIFEYALNKFHLNPYEVVHVGDSVSSDVMGAAEAGINAVWLNRFNKPNKKNYTNISSLSDIFNLRCFTSVL